MPRRTNRFQTLIAFIEALKAQASGLGVTVTESALIQDPASGNDREVDVLLEGNINGHALRMVVECRDHQRPQDVTWIEQLDSKAKRLGLDKVVAVSSSGFTDAAVKAAKSMGIRTLSLQEALEVNLPQELEIHSVFVRGSFLCRKVVFFFASDVDSEFVLDDEDAVALIDEKEVGKLRDLTDSIFLGLTRQPLEFAVENSDLMESIDRPDGTCELCCVQRVDTPGLKILLKSGEEYSVDYVVFYLAIEGAVIRGNDRRFLYDDTVVLESCADVPEDGIELRSTAVRLDRQFGSGIALQSMSIVRAAPKKGAVDD